LISSWSKRTSKNFPPEAIILDGYDSLKVASRFGVVELARQVCYHKLSQSHTMPGNRVLPVHQGMVITRGLQEWACLLPQDLPFEAVERLLGWQTQEQQVLCATTIRALVRQHGRLIRQAYEAEAEALLDQADLAELKPVLVEAPQPRYRAGWPAALTTAVEAALAEENPPPPEGVSPADWERVLNARRQEKELSTRTLRYLGPQVQTDQVIASTDEVLTRKPEKRRFWELRTARVATSQGYRYLNGVGDSFVQLLLVFILLCLQTSSKQILILADGAKWVRNFYLLLRTRVPTAQLILDWFHLQGKCYQLSSMICSGKKAKATLLGSLYYHLWRGQLDEAIQILTQYRPHAKSAEKLEELLDYLQARRAFIPDYQDRRRQRLYIGSGQAEKANDLIVARRQKHQGMHWSLETSDALATLKTLMLNQGWTLYWQDRQVLPLAVAST
jgi:hypothetical protein